MGRPKAVKKGGRSATLVVLPQRFKKERKKLESRKKSVYTSVANKNREYTFLHLTITATK